MTERLSTGDTAPAFDLPTLDGRVSLADFKGGRLVVYFYPAAMTPGCTKQAVDFTTHLADFVDAGYQIVGISPDSPTKLAKFTEKDELKITLAADEDKSIMRAYRAFGLKKLYGKEGEGVIRSTFVVDVDEAGVGTIAVAQYNVKATGHVAKLLRDLKIVDLT